MSETMTDNNLPTMKMQDQMNQMIRKPKQVPAESEHTLKTALDAFGYERVE